MRVAGGGGGGYCAGATWHPRLTRGDCVCLWQAAHEARRELLTVQVRMTTGELCSWTHFILAEILVPVGGAIPSAPAVPASTRISAGLKRVQEHSSPVRMKLQMPCFSLILGSLDW